MSKAQTPSLALTVCKAGSARSLCSANKRVGSKEFSNASLDIWAGCSENRRQATPNRRGQELESTGIVRFLYELGSGGPDDLHGEVVE
jgi:hypothetical protein